MKNIIVNIEYFIKQIFTHKIYTIIIKLSLILYIILITPKLSPTLLLLFNSPYFKFLVLCLIYYISIYNPYISILISIAFVLSIYTVNSIKIINHNFYTK
jgi:hypothetical protein